MVSQERFNDRSLWHHFYLSRKDSHLFQVVSDSKFVSVGVQSPTEINAPRGCAVILVKNMSAYADQNHAPSLAAARLEFVPWNQIIKVPSKSMLVLVP